MSLARGMCLGPYEVLGLIGAGGMGEVYKARDTRLDRTVAIKVLPEQFAEASERQQRFEREARVVAALNHPHICSLYDVGEDQGIGYLVMEYLEGQTLADRLVRGPLLLDELLRCTVEIADALDHAHRCGLVHRDLKPGNVMLTKAGATLLDFGLSKLQSSITVPALATVAPDATELTAAGVLVGTFPYMSPEQLTGREVDARSDIFALGAMAYEMATGRRAFAGTTAATVIGAILHVDPPPVSSLQPLTSPALDHLVARCLAKDPNDRWQTARDVMLELKWIEERTAAPVTDAGQRRKSGVIAAAMLSVVAIVTAALSVAYVRRAPGDDRPIRFTFSPPAGVTLNDVTAAGPVTISPDGRLLAFVATGADGTPRIWIRPLESLAARALAGTDGGAYPFWSPDSHFLGFFVQGKVKKIPATGGAAQIVADATGPRGGTWSADGVILFSAGVGRQLYRVPAGGGVATALAADAVNEERYWPSFLPDGRNFVYYGRPQKWGIYVASLDSPDTTRFLREGVGVAYANGHLLVLLGANRGSAAGTLLAQPFDLTDLRLAGEPRPVAEQIGYQSLVARGAFSVSETGTLAYGTIERPATQLIWFDRGGKALGRVGGSVAFKTPRLSPDGKTLAVERIDPETQQEDLWLIETTRDLPSRFTSYDNFDVMPVWSPDGTRIVFASARGTPPNLYQKALAGAGDEELLVKSTGVGNHPTDWSRDGRFIAYASLHPRTQWDLWFLPMSGPDRTPVPFLQSDFNEHLARFSPDGKWLAYVSDESGTSEVYVQQFPLAGVRRRISANGGTAPRWRADGLELFYLAADATVMAVSVKPGSNLDAGAPAALFKSRISRGADGGSYWPDRKYSVTSDGRRFLIETDIEDVKSVPTTIVLNWPGSLRR